MLRSSAFSSWASCFLIKVRTAWTASGSATSIMSIISPSPGRVIAFATNSYSTKGKYSSLIHQFSWALQKDLKGNKGPHHTLSKLKSDSMLLSPCTNFGFKTKGLFCWKSATKLSISLRASTCPASQLQHKYKQVLKHIKNQTEVHLIIMEFYCFAKDKPVEFIWIISKE